MHLTATFIQSNLNSRIKIYFMNWNEINMCIKSMIIIIVFTYRSCCCQKQDHRSTLTQSAQTNSDKNDKFFSDISWLWTEDILFHSVAWINFRRPFTTRYKSDCAENTLGPSVTDTHARRAQRSTFIHFALITFRSVAIVTHTHTHAGCAM